MRFSITTLLIFLLTAFSSATAKDIKSVRQQRETAKKELQKANSKLRDNEAGIMSRLNQLNLVEAEIETLGKEIRTTKAKYNAITKKSAALNDSIEIATAQLNRMRNIYAAAVTRTHHNTGKLNDIMFVFSADNFRQGLQRYRYLKQYAAWQKKQAQSIMELQRNIAEKQQRLDAAAAAAKASLATLNESMEAIEARKAEQMEMINSLKNQSKQLKNAIASQQRKLNQLDNELNKLIREEEKRAQQLERERQARERELAAANAKTDSARRALAQNATTKPTQPASKPATKPTTPTPKPKVQQPEGEFTKLSGDFENNKGKLAMPVTGKATIVKHFGRQRHEQLKNVETNNGGIDIETDADSKARAIFNGKVTGVFRTADFNNVVMVRHGEYLTIYVNIAGVNVKSGQEIKAGDIIGSIFSDANDNNRTILHFEIRKEIEKLDPEQWLKQQ